MSKVPTLRLPGRVLAQFAERAGSYADEFNPDFDLALAISRTRVKQRGAGFTAYVQLSAEQVLRLADWVKDDDPKLLRDYRDAMRQQARVAIDP